jgi:hypothetical protein
VIRAVTALWSGAARAEAVSAGEIERLIQTKGAAAACDRHCYGP